MRQDKRTYLIPSRHASTDEPDTCQLSGIPASVVCPKTGSVTAKSAGGEGSIAHVSAAELGVRIENQISLPSESTRARRR